MWQPKGYVAKGRKLQRSIYGLKQASRLQNIRFDETITSYGFENFPHEPCVYNKF